MNKIFAFLALAAFAACPLSAQSLKDLFLHMPQELCPSLSEYNKLELVDNQKNNKPMQTRNLFKTISEMKELTDRHAHLIVSENSEKEMLLLTQSDNTNIILMINTVICDSIVDSSVHFYTTDWQPLPSSDFINTPSTDEFQRISLNPASNQLTITKYNPLVLQTDGSDKPAPMPASTSQIFMWEREQNKFVQQ